MKHRITTDIFKSDDGREFTITFRPDGIHIHEKFARGGDRVIGLRELVTNSLVAKAKPVKADARFKDGSPAETLDVVACDLYELAQSVHHRTATKGMAAEVRKSLAKAQGIVKGLEVVL